MPRLFLVDTENTNDYSFINKYLVNSEDEIVLFISDKMKAVKSEGCIDLLTSKGKIFIEKIENGEKNALDFQLVVYVTERAICGDYDKIYIVSKDHGYRPVVKYIRNKFDKCIVILGGKEDNEHFPIKENKSPDNSKEETLDYREKIKRAINKVEPDASDAQINTIVKLKDNDAQLSEIHNALLKMFKNNGKEIYKYLKPLVE